MRLLVLLVCLGLTVTRPSGALDFLREMPGGLCPLGCAGEETPDFIKDWHRVSLLQERMQRQLAAGAPILVSRSAGELPRLPGAQILVKSPDDLEQACPEAGLFRPVTGGRLEGSEAERTRLRALLSLISSGEPRDSRE